MIKTFPQIIKQAVQRHPEHQAFRCGSAILYYSDLDKKTDQLASYLVSKGIKKGDRVGVYMNRCIETAIAIYGIMKAGAVYVPLDSTLPLARISFLINDCGIEHLVSIPQLGKKHLAIFEHKVQLKSIIGSSKDLPCRAVSWAEIYNLPLNSDLEKIEITENDLAYIMYTSGSTGHPKGIMHTHSSGLSYARLSVKTFELTDADILANHAPLHFDISTLGYFAGPMANATTVLILDAHTKMPASLAKLIESEKITVWYSVPLALVQLLQSKTLPNLDLSSLRLVMFGGEVFANKYLSQLMKLLPKVEFHNIYGPAEVNQCTSYHVQSVPNDNEILPIGKVWKNTSLKIIDQNDNEVSKGEIGELLIHSTTRMQGYWNNLELTKKASYSKNIDGLLRTYHRTGDMVKENENGELLFFGRKDKQVKIRGYRIEIEEIEACIAQVNEVEEICVIVLQLSADEKEIVAVIKKIEGGVVTEAEILNFCKMRLPPYSVPQSVVFLDTFPRTGTGKIDRNQVADIILNMQNE